MKGCWNLCESNELLVKKISGFEPDFKMIFEKGAQEGEELPDKGQRPTLEQILAADQ